tara:strand:- start:974 stop:1822 length:849 start_codon:yes stop_codon:yes gene_type:complete
MKYTLSWQDFMRQPENKQLKESKGIHACKQKFIQEQNKLMWNDPMMLNEQANDAGAINAANAHNGGSTNWITGHTAEVSTLTFTNGLNVDFTASLGNTYFDIEGYNGSEDFSLNHTNTMKTFRCYITSESLATFAPTVPGHVNGVIAASVSKSSDASKHGTGSITHDLRTSIASNTATATVAGFTNTIAPSTLFTAVSSSVGSVLTITNVNKGSVAAITTPTTVSSSLTASLQYNTEISLGTGTASVATSTNGLDKWYGDFDNAAQVFDGDTGPHNAFPRKQ